ncbi:MAG: hypothetical protein J6A62_04915 [Oscillospiraceae bacterium]|nr:hypothetical protein [Oscillospiraceae bacterium]
MKKEILLPAAAWLGGVVGFGLRRWELAVAYNPQTKLMDTCPATWALTALFAVLLVLFAAGCIGMGRRDAKEWFYAPDTACITLSVCAGLVLIMAGAAGFWEQSLAYRADVIGLAVSGLCIAGGVTALMAGKAIYRGQWSQQVPILLMGPAFALLAWLVAVYQSNARQPELQLYVWQVLSAVALVLALYGVVSVSLGRGSAGRTVVYALMGIALTPAAMADGSSLSFNLVWISGAVYLTAHSYMLLRNASGIPWPERMPSQTQKEQTDEPEE